MEPPKKLIVVVGPTAVGKTDFCIELAQSLGTEIVSADSRQVYQEMSIGTARPSAKELARVPHHLVGFRSVTQPYSAAAFAKDALQTLEQLWAKYPIVVMTGGSGLYIKAVCDGLTEIPNIPEQIRQDLVHTYTTHGLRPLWDELQAVDRVYYEQCDKHNPRRVLRALEVYRATQKPFSEFQRKPTTPLSCVMIGLTLPRAVLYERINRRVDVMVSQGLFEEAARLYPERHYKALQTIGYQEIFAYMEGGCTKAEAIAAIKQHTRHYAKRQLTWFRKDPRVRWYEPEELRMMPGAFC